MARYFNGKKVELLAPSGTMETLERMVGANCDAIYFGGKSLNMRMMRKGYNFSDEETIKAVKMAHDVDKKVYITVNNMLNESDIKEAVEYLHFLNGINVDGIIIQDLSILQICKEYGLYNFEIHSSVMMNVHNISTVKKLKELGMSRIVLPREMDLKTAKNLQNQTGIETEYFVHGDMCVVNGANCYYSSVVLGNSSNRGRCFKPCRWPYLVKKEGHVYPTEYPLAAKDMYMYENIPELIEADITSFKIEGRMRNTDFILDLVNTYGDAIDRYIEDPLDYDNKKQSEELYGHRKRDFTTAYAFSKPGLSFINSRYEGTGKFYSTGKMFSTPTKEPEITKELITDIHHEWKSYGKSVSPEHHLSVKVNNYLQAKLCIDLEVNRIYLPCEVLAPDQFISKEQLMNLVDHKKNTEIYLDLPQMMDEMWFDKIDQYLSGYGEFFDGLMVSSLGAMNRYKDRYRLISSFNVNIYNHKALEFYKEQGISEASVSIEIKRNELAELISKSKIPLELTAHGPLKVMYLDHNLYDNTGALEPISKEDNAYVDNSILVLKTEKGENPVYIDQTGKNHLFTAKEFCILPILDTLNFGTLVNLRIEGQTYTTEQLQKLIEIYRKAIMDPSRAGNLYDSMKFVRAGFTLGALTFKNNN